MTTTMTKTTEDGSCAEKRAAEAATCVPGASFSSPCCRLKDWFLGKNPSTTTTTTTTSASSDVCASDASWDRIFLLDGGVSTNLEQKDSDNGNGFAHVELWSSSLLLTESGRRAIVKGHTDWLQTGRVNLLSTVTYQCHYKEQLWPKKGDVMLRCKQDMDELWNRGIRLAAQALKEYHSSASSCTSTGNATAIRRPTFLVASSGCYGAALANGAEYTGDYGPDMTLSDLSRFHRLKIQQIVASSSNNNNQDEDGGVDCIAIETVPSLTECQALVRLLSEPDTVKLLEENHITCWISLACGDGQHLNDGTRLVDALQVLNALPPEVLPAIGLNCCDFRHLSSLVEILVTFLAEQQQQQQQQQQPTRALVLYPNSGEEWDAVNKVFKTPTATSTSSSTPVSSGAGGTNTTEASSSSLSMVDSMKQVIQTVETTWRNKTKSTGASSTAEIPPPLPYPRMIVGGCCRTTPTEIAALRVAINAHLEKERQTEPS